jgi:hypothetical protein
LNRKEKGFLRFKNTEFYDEFKSSKTKEFNKYVYNIDYNITNLNNILKIATEENFMFSNETRNDVEFFLFLKDGKVIDVRNQDDLPMISKLKKIDNY